MKQTILIIGLQGTGKTTKAFEIATGYNTYVTEATHNPKRICAEIRANLPYGTSYVICDGILPEQIFSEEFKCLCTASIIHVNRKFEVPTVVKAPTFIFTLTCRREELPADLFDLIDHRYQLIDLNS